MSTPEVPGYDVQDRLGAGGMGEVYRARCRPDGRVVALKIEGETASKHPQAHFRERFLREARILRELHHENLPQFFGVGEVPDGRVFIAMELLIGRQFTEFSGQSLETLLPLFLQCARALKVTSEAGIVHRDVAPDNFFVVEVGGRSVVKLIDFGISRDAAAIADGLTRAGTFLGKLKYCSPEQTGLMPGLGPVDWRTDLYSFGLTMYALLLGRLPFGGSSPQAQFQARAVELHPEVFEAIPSERLRRLLAKMLLRSPERRPGSFDEVVAELLRVQAELAQEQASALDESVRQQARDSRTPTGTSRAAPALTDVAEEASSAEPPPPRAAFLSVVSTEGLAFVALLLIGGSLLLFATGAGEGSVNAALSPSRISAIFLCLGAGAAALAFARFRVGRSDRSRRGGALRFVEDPPEVRAATGVRGETVGRGASGAHLVVSGDGPTRDVWLCGDQDGSWPPEIVIGRAVTEGPSSVRIECRAVSGLQARLRHQGGTFSIENLSRTNTTRVNGRDLAQGEKRLLAVGDRVEMGPVTVSFHVR